MKSMILGNWKMNPANLKEAKKLFEATKKAADTGRDVSLIVVPPALYLHDLTANYRGKRLSFGVQNAHIEKTGSFTGEISFSQAKDAGATYAIIGHAERRAVGETNDDVKKKVEATLALSMTPILCIGEMKREQDGSHFTFIKEQIRVGFADVPANKIGKVIVAYEPVWAIGATVAMNPRDMHEMAIFIRKTIVELYGEKGMSVKILYGGSVDETNAVAMLQQGDVDGLLVGRVSTDAEKLLALVRAIQSA